MIEGEGCFSMYDDPRDHSRPHPRVALGTTDRDVADSVAAFLGASVWTDRRERIGAKSIHMITLVGARAIALMRDIYPLMHSRRRARIDEIIAACDPDGTRYVAEERQPKHGTRYEYARYRCRCMDCVSANSAYSRAYKAQRL